jgi:hypothetical protein
MRPLEERHMADCFGSEFEAQRRRARCWLLRAPTFDAEVPVVPEPAYTLVNRAMDDK